VPPDTFFDEDWEEPSRRTEETAPKEQSGRRTRRLPAGSEAARRLRSSIPQRGRGPRAGGPEWGRLAVLAVGVLVGLLLLVLLVRSCGGDSATDRNEAYFTQVERAVNESDGAGARLRQVLLGAPQRRQQVESRLRVAQERARDAANRAAGVEPTSEMEPYHRSLRMALEYRQEGMGCLVRAIPQAYRNAAGGQLLPCMQILLASDVVYDLSYRGPAERAVRDLDVQVPESDFLAPALQSLMTERSLRLALERLKPSTVRKGVHGLQLEGVRVDPGGNELEPGGTLNRVTVTDDLAFVVTALNQGEFQEVNVPVTLIFGTGENRIRRRATIEQIEPGGTASARFTQLFSIQQQPPFAEPTRLSVRVEPVAGERTAENNAETYTVTLQVAEP
jgi:hypothetical protein